MTTAVMLGKFRDDPNLKQEFYNLMLSMKGHNNNETEVLRGIL